METSCLQNTVKRCEINQSKRCVTELTNVVRHLFLDPVWLHIMKHDVKGTVLQVLHSGIKFATLPLRKQGTRWMAFYIKLEKYDLTHRTSSKPSLDSLGGDFFCFISASLASNFEKT